MIISPHAASPIITTELSNYNISHQNAVGLTCTSIGVPLPTIQWWKQTEFDGLVLLNSSSHIILNHTISGTGEVTSNIYILQSKVSDSGNYTCVAQNDVGVASSTAVLDVLGEILLYHNYFF